MKIIVIIIIIIIMNFFIIIIIIIHLIYLFNKGLNIFETKVYISIISISIRTNTQYHTWMNSASVWCLHHWTTLCPRYTVCAGRTRSYAAESRTSNSPHLFSSVWSVQSFTPSQRRTASLHTLSHMNCPLGHCWPGGVGGRVCGGRVFGF